MKNWFSRLLAGCTFAIGSTAPFIIATQPSLANVSVPANEVTSQLRQSQIPILLPSSLPGSDSIYLDNYSSANSYTVEMYYTPDCGGSTYCYMGSIQGERGGQFETPWEGDTSQWLQLSQGTRGLFINSCGAYCMTTLSWQSNNVLYTVTLKNGRQADLVQIANSAIQAGPRNQRLASSPTEVRSVSWVVFDPPSNVRVTPNGEVQCTIREVRAINFYGWSGEWAETDACGSRGYIHTSQIESVD